MLDKLAYCCGGIADLLAKTPKVLLPSSDTSMYAESKSIKPVVLKSDTGVHDVQAEAPDKLEEDPAGHDVQAEAPVAFEKVPAGHAAHTDGDVAPVAFEKVPAGHAAHTDGDVAPVAFEKDPAGHALQTEAFQKLPAWHWPLQSVAVCIAIISTAFHSVEVEYQSGASPMTWPTPTVARKTDTADPL